MVVAWARTRPGYDPYGWLVWGRQALEGRLDLGGSPSWKPLPFLFTFPYALVGHSELWLWMVTAVGVALAGCLAAARIAHRIVAGIASDTAVGGGVARVAPAAAAVVAGLGVLTIQTYPHYILSAQSDPMITAFCLIAVDCLLRGRRAPAIGSLGLAALGRPEVWPFVALLVIWGWVQAPRLRLLLLVAVGLIAGMWFGVPWITNGRPALAGQLAENTRQLLRHDQLTGTIDHFTPLHSLSMWIAAAVGLALGGLRRNRVVVLLAAASVLWVAVEIGLALDSLPVLPRFMFEAAAIAAVLSGVGVGAAAVELARLRAGPGMVRWGSALLAVGAAAGLLVPVAIARVGSEQSDLRQLHHRSHELAMLQSLIGELGGTRRVRSCGEPVTYVSDASAVAWLTGLNVGQVGYKPGREMRRWYPVIVFRSVKPFGWTVQPWHLRSTDRLACSRLHVSDRGRLRSLASARHRRRYQARHRRDRPRRPRVQRRRLLGGGGS